MLKTLKRIVQEVNAAKDLAMALNVMVSRIRETMETESCSIYLVDPPYREFVLMATKGLNENVVGKIRLGIEEGLIGFVLERGEPINLKDASSHPRYVFHPDLGEDNYKAFLGVPIIYQRKNYGVIAIQETEIRCFDESEEAFLVTITAQLAGVIAHAEATGALSDLKPISPLASNTDEVAIGGLPSVAGVGIGIGVATYPLADLDAVPMQPTDSPEHEITLFREALAATKAEIQNLSERIQTHLPAAEHALFDVYLKILEGDTLGTEVEKHIQAGIWAEGALKTVIQSHVHHFNSMEDPYLSERAADFKDLGRRLLAHLQSKQKRTLDYPKDTVLVGDEVTASALAEVPEGHLAAIVSRKGSNNSHVAILARALGIPTVMGAKGVSVHKLAGKKMIVDGYYGQVYQNPSARLLAQFATLVNEENELNESLASLRLQPSITPDGHPLALYVNTGLPVDATLSLTVGAEGVGLYRTELPFMTRDRFPAEEEQRIIYHQLLKAFSPRPVTMRTLDVGGDKTLPYFPIEEDNPFLGWRGIRITLDHPDVFLLQLRAMLRASMGLKNLRILLPMVSHVGELDEAIRYIEQAHKEVTEELEETENPIPYPKIGVMIEVPSAVYQAREFARRVDFLSVGSNDLVQYLLAVDRSNAKVADLYEALHPAVLRALIQVVEGGHAEGKPVGLCGEMGSDPVSVIILLAMGFDNLSVNPTVLPRIKWVVRNFTLAYARKLLSEVLEMENATLIRFHLEKAIDEAGLGGLIRAGKK